MELKELTEKTCSLFDVSNPSELSSVLLKACNDEHKLEAFADMVEDLSIDWLQKIFQYYNADRKDKKQDYTPKTLAQFLGKLVSDDSQEVIDLCAGSGALTIQKWNMNHNTQFKLFEIDKEVIPFLCFNMVLRNIECEIFLADVLKDEVYKHWIVSKGKRFGKVREVKND